MALTAGLGGQLLGTLFVRLTANSTDLVRGMNAAHTAVGRSSKEIMASVGLMSAAVVGAFAAVAGAAALMTKKSIDAADAMLESAQIAGQAVEKFSALAHAASMASVSTSDLALASKFLTQWMEKNNIESQDLTEVLVNQADEFSRMADGPEKLRMAYERFGRSGAQLIPLLNQGSDALRRQMEEAKAFGVVVGPQFGANADAFNDNMTRISAAFRGMFNQIAEKVLPVLLELQDRFIEWLKVAENQEKVINALSTAWEAAVIVAKTLALGVLTIWKAFKILSIIIATEWRLAWELLKLGFETAIQLQKIWFDSITAVIAAVYNLGRAAGQVGNIMVSFLKKDFGAVGAGVAMLASGVDDVFKKLGTTMSENVSKATTLVVTSASKAVDMTVGMVTGGVQDIKAEWNDWLTTGTKIMNGFELSGRNAAVEIGKATQSIKDDTEETMKLLDQIGMPKQQFFDPFTQQGVDLSGEITAHEESLRQLQNILDEKRNITEEAQLRTLESIAAHNEKLKELHMAQAVIIVQSAQNMFDSLAHTTEQFAGKQSGAYKAMFAASKAFAVAESVIKIQQGIASALSLGWPMGIVAAASVIAQAANVVSTIKSVQLEFGGERAEGGPVTTGKSFLVGEEGPEMFTPSQAGSIIPNDEMGGRGVNVTVNNYTDASVEVKQKGDDSNSVEVMIRRVKGEIGSEIRDGRGEVNKAMQDSFALRRGNK